MSEKSKSAMCKALGVKRRASKKLEHSFRKEFIKFLWSLGCGYVLDTHLNAIPGFYSPLKNVPDLFFFYQGSAFGIELKKDKDAKTSPGQKKEHQKIERLSGVPVFVVHPDNFQIFKDNFFNVLTKVKLLKTLEKDTLC